MLVALVSIFSHWHFVFNFLPPQSPRFQELNVDSGDTLTNGLTEVNDFRNHGILAVPLPRA
jgi:hypothetical protein